jgi:hypothetical protein
MQSRRQRQVERASSTHHISLSKTSLELIFLRHPRAPPQALPCSRCPPPQPHRPPAIAAGRSVLLSGLLLGLPPRAGPVDSPCRADTTACGPCGPRRRAPLHRPTLAAAWRVHEKGACGRLGLKEEGRGGCEGLIRMPVQPAAVCCSCDSVLQLLRLQAGFGLGCRRQSLLRRKRYLECFAVYDIGGVDDLSKCTACTTVRLGYIGPTLL